MDHVEGNYWTDSNGMKRARSGLPTETVDVSAAVATGADVDYSSQPLRAIYAGAAGSVWVRRFGDAAGSWFEYAVDKGARIPGVIVAVGASGAHTTSPSMKLVGER